LVCYRFFSQSEFIEKRELIRTTIWEICREKNDLLYVALNEAVNNAFFHGYKGAPYAPVEVILYQEDNNIVMIVRHEGRGVAISRRSPRKRGVTLSDHGRGLEIIQKCTDFCQFDEAGQELTMRKQITFNNYS